MADDKKLSYESDFTLLFKSEGKEAILKELETIDKEAQGVQKTIDNIGKGLSKPKSVKVDTSTAMRNLKKLQTLTERIQNSSKNTVKNNQVFDIAKQIKDMGGYNDELNSMFENMSLKIDGVVHKGLDDMLAAYAKGGKSIGKIKFNPPDVEYSAKEIESATKEYGNCITKLVKYNRDLQKAMETNADPISISDIKVKADTAKKSMQELAKIIKDNNSLIDNGKKAINTYNGITRQLKAAKVGQEVTNTPKTEEQPTVTPVSQPTITKDQVKTWKELKTAADEAGKAFEKAHNKSAQALGEYDKFMKENSDVIDYMEKIQDLSKSVNNIGVNFDGFSAAQKKSQHKDYVESTREIIQKLIDAGAFETSAVTKPRDIVSYRKYEESVLANYNKTTNDTMNTLMQKVFKEIGTLYSKTVTDYSSFDQHMSSDQRAKVVRKRELEQQIRLNNMEYNAAGDKQTLAYQALHAFEKKFEEIGINIEEHVKSLESSGAKKSEVAKAKAAQEAAEAEKAETQAIETKTAAIQTSTRKKRGNLEYGFVEETETNNERSIYKNGKYNGLFLLRQGEDIGTERNDKTFFSKGKFSVYDQNSQSTLRENLTLKAAESFVEDLYTKYGEQVEKYKDKNVSFGNLIKYDENKEKYLNEILSCVDEFNKTPIESKNIDTLQDLLSNIREWVNSVVGEIPAEILGSDFANKEILSFGNKNYKIDDFINAPNTEAIPELDLTRLIEQEVQARQNNIEAVQEETAAIKDTTQTSNAKKNLLITDLGLDTRIENMLRRAGLNTTDDANKYFGEKGVTGVVSQKAWNVYSEALSSRGMELPILKQVEATKDIAEAAQTAAKVEQTEAKAIEQKTQVTSRYVDEIQADIDKTKNIINVQKQWIDTLTPLLDENSYKTSGKKEATERLKTANANLTDYRRHPNKYGYMSMAKERLEYKAGAAYKEAERVGVARSTLIRERSDIVDDWALSENKKKLTQELEYHQLTLKSSSKRLEALQKELSLAQQIKKETDERISQERLVREAEAVAKRDAQQQSQAQVSEQALLGQTSATNEKAIDPAKEFSKQLNLPIKGLIKDIRQIFDSISEACNTSDIEKYNNAISKLTDIVISNTKQIEVAHPDKERAIQAIESFVSRERNTGGSTSVHIDSETWKELSTKYKDNQGGLQSLLNTLFGFGNWSATKGGIGVDVISESLAQQFNKDAIGNGIIDTLETVYGILTKYTTTDITEEVQSLNDIKDRVEKVALSLLKLNGIKSETVEQISMFGDEVQKQNNIKVKRLPKNTRYKKAVRSIEGQTSWLDEWELISDVEESISTEKVNQAQIGAQATTSELEGYEEILSIEEQINEKERERNNLSSTSLTNAEMLMNILKSGNDTNISEQLGVLTNDALGILSTSKNNQTPAVNLKDISGPEDFESRIVNFINGFFDGSDFKLKSIDTRGGRSIVTLIDEKLQRVLTQRYELVPDMMAEVEDEADRPFIYQNTDNRYYHDIEKYNKMLTKVSAEKKRLMASVESLAVEATDYGVSLGTIYDDIESMATEADITMQKAAVDAIKSKISGAKKKIQSTNSLNKKNQRLETLSTIDDFIEGAKLDVKNNVNDKGYKQNLGKIISTMIATSIKAKNENLTYDDRLAAYNDLITAQTKYKSKYGTALKNERYIKNKTSDNSESNIRELELLNQKIEKAQLHTKNLRSDIESFRGIKGFDGLSDSIAKMDQHLIDAKNHSDDIKAATHDLKLYNAERGKYGEFLKSVKDEKSKIDTADKQNKLNIKQNESDFKDLQIINRDLDIINGKMKQFEDQMNSLGNTPGVNKVRAAFDNLKKSIEAGLDPAATLEEKRNAVFNAKNYETLFSNAYKSTKYTQDQNIAKEQADKKAADEEAASKAKAESDRINQTYNDLVRTIQKINNLNSEIYKSQNKDGGSGLLRPYIESLKEERDVLEDELKSIQSSISQFYQNESANGIGYLQGAKEIITPDNTLTRGDSSVINFLNDTRTQAELTQAQIDKLVESLGKTREFDTTVGTDIVNMFKPITDTANRLSKIDGLDQSSLMGLVEEINNYQQKMANGNISWDSQEIDNLKKLIDQYTQYGNKLAEIGEKERSYFANKKKLNSDTNLQDLANIESEANKTKPFVQQMLEQRAKELAGENSIFATGFNVNQLGISQLDFSVFDKATNSLRNFKIEMGSVTEGMYVTENTVNKSLASINNAQKQMQTTGNLLSMLSNGGVNINPDDAAKPVQRMLDTYRQLESEMNRDGGPNQDRLSYLSDNAKRATKEVEKLYSQMVKMDNELEDDSSGTTKLGEGDLSKNVQSQLRDAVIEHARTMQNAEVITGRFNNATSKLPVTFKLANGEIRKCEAEFSKLNGKMVLHEKSMSQVSQTVSKSASAYDKFKKSLGSVGKQMLTAAVGYNVFYKALSMLRTGVGYVKEIDLAMTELKKVTDETASTYDKFMNSAYSSAGKVGATVSDFTNATANFARLGYSMDESADMAETAIVYKNVADGINDIDTATSSIISTLKAFNVESTDTMSIADKFNEVGNKFAITSAGIGDALTRSASALAAGGNTLDESIALITGANSVVQDPDVVGTALKTLSLRIRGVKTELEDAGLDAENMAETTATLQAKLLALSHGEVDVMKNANEFKSTTEILRELAGAWEHMTDVEQAAAIELVAGKRQAWLCLNVQKCA